MRPQAYPPSALRRRTGRRLRQHDADRPVYRGAGRKAAYFTERLVDMLAGETHRGPSRAAPPPLIPSAAFPFPPTVTGPATEQRLPRGPGPAPGQIQRRLAAAPLRAVPPGHLRGQGIATFVEPGGIMPRAPGPGRPRSATRPRSPSAPTARSPWPSAPAATARATRPPSPSWPPGPAEGGLRRRDGGVRRHGRRPVRLRHLRLTVTGGGRHRDLPRFVPGGPGRGPPGRRSPMPVSEAAARLGGISATGSSGAPPETYATGAYGCEVAVDPRPARSPLLQVIAVDDCGVLVNPLLVEGQVHGAVAQGVGQALTEQVSYDENGQPMSASLMDYAVPFAATAPAHRVLLGRHPVTAQSPWRQGHGQSPARSASPRPWSTPSWPDPRAVRRPAPGHAVVTAERVWTAIHESPARPDHGA